MKFIKIITIIGVVYAALALALDSAVGYFQPESGRTAVLRTFDAAGQPYDRVLLLLNDDGQLWVESGHWFRGWYRQALANPNVVLIQEGQEAPYVATPVNSPETVDKITRLMGKGSDNRYWVGRAICLFAPIKPLRLDPVGTQEGSDATQQDAVSAEQVPVGSQESAGVQEDAVGPEQVPGTPQEDAVGVSQAPPGVQQNPETTG